MRRPGQRLSALRCRIPAYAKLGTADAEKHIAELISIAREKCADPALSGGLVGGNTRAASSRTYSDDGTGRLSARGLTLEMRH